MNNKKQKTRLENSVKRLGATLTEIKDKTATWNDDLENIVGTTIPAAGQWAIDFSKALSKLRDTKSRAQVELQRYKFESMAHREFPVGVEMETQLNRQIAELHREIKAERRRIFLSRMRKRYVNATRPIRSVIGAINRIVEAKR